MLVKFLEALYRVLSLLGPKVTDLVTSSSCGSLVAGAPVGLGSGLGSAVGTGVWVGVGKVTGVGVGTGVLVAVGVTTGSAVAVAGGMVAVGASVFVGAGVAVGLGDDVGTDVAVGTDAAVGGVVGVGVGATVAVGGNVAVAAGGATGTEVAEEPQAAANNTAITASPAISQLLFLGPIKNRFIKSLTPARSNPAEDYLCHAVVQLLVASSYVRSKAAPATGAVIYLASILWEELYMQSSGVRLTELSHSAG